MSTAFESLCGAECTLNSCDSDTESRIKGSRLAGPTAAHWLLCCLHRGLHSFVKFNNIHCCAIKGGCGTLNKVIQSDFLTLSAWAGKNGGRKSSNSAYLQQHIH
eukprot:3456711-Amphidinium_carterae.1